MSTRKDERDKLQSGAAKRIVLPGGGDGAGVGLLDLHRNVWKWCENWERPFPAGTVTAPSGQFLPRRLLGCRRPVLPFGLSLLRPVW